MGISEVKRLIKAGEVIPFVGAGVSLAVLAHDSRNSLFPSWKQLLLNGAAKLRETDSNTAVAIESLLALERPDYLYIANLARTSLPDWFKFLKEEFDHSRNRALDESLALARQVWNLGSSIIITTNYDKVLRWACPNQSDVREWDVEAAYEQGEVLKKGCHHPTVWHVHGHIDNVANIILTADDYNKIYAPATGVSVFQAAFESLRTLMSTKSFLFIGYSLDDVKLVAELDRIAKIFNGGTGPHFALVREKDVAEVKSLKLPITIIPFTNFGDPLIELLEDLSGAGARPALLKTATVFPTKSNIAEQVVIIGNKKARDDLKSAVSRWAKGDSGNGTILVVGEEGTGKSLVINECCQQAGSGFLIIKLSGRSYQKSPERFVFHVLGSIFGVDPNYDGKIISELDRFCVENQLVSASRLVKYLQICQGAFDTTVPDSSRLPSFTGSVQPYTESEGATAFSQARATFCPYTELWRVIKVYGRQSGVKTILWLEDAQIFYNNTPEIIIALFQNASEGDTTSLLIGEFRAEKSRDISRFKETFEGYSKSKAILLKELQRDEVAELIAYVLRVPKHSVPNDLVRDILKSSGGNPKFVVDYIKYLREQGIVCKESTAALEEEIVYNKQYSKGIPTELKSICKERILHHCPTKSESWVLSLMAVLDLQEVPVRLLKRVIDDADAAVETLKEDLGILKYCDGIDDWRVCFEHLTARESCLELLEETSKSELDELLNTLQAVISNKLEETSASDMISIRAMLAEVAFYAENLESLSKLIIYKLLYATKNDLSYLRKLAKLYSKDLSGADLIEVTKSIIILKINEIEHSEVNQSAHYNNLLKSEKYLYEWEDLFFHKAVISVLAYGLARMSAANQDDLGKACCCMASMVSQVWKSAPSKSMKIGATAYLLHSYFSNLEDLHVSKLKVFDALFAEFHKGPLSILECNISFWSLSSYFLSEESSHRWTRHLCEVVSACKKHLTREGACSSDEENDFFAYAGISVILSLLHKASCDRGSSLQEIVDLYYQLEEFTVLCDSMMPDSERARVMQLQNAQSEVAKSVAMRGDLETATKIVKKAFNASKSQANEIIVISNLLVLEYTCAGANITLARELIEKVLSCTEYSCFTPKDMETIISALLIAKPIKEIDFDALLISWVKDLSKLDTDLIKILQFINDARSYCLFDVKKVFFEIKNNFKISHSMKLFMNVMEHYIFSQLEAESNDSRKDDIYIRHIRRLKEICESNDLSEVKDINLGDFAAYVQAGMIAEVSPSQRDAGHLFKYGKRLLEQQFGRVSKSVSYYQKRWSLMFNLKETVEIIEECHELLGEENSFDKGFIYSWLRFVHTPQLTKDGNQCNCNEAYRYACLHNDFAPDSTESFAKLINLLEMDSSLTCENLSERYERCLTGQLEVHDYKEAYKVARDYLLYIFGQGQHDQALLLIEDAIQYSMRVVPPDLELMLSIKNAEQFITMSKYITNAERLRHCAVAYETLVDELDAISDADKRSLITTEVLIKYNFACASLLSAYNLERAGNILNDILKDDKFKSELSTVIEYLIICEFDTNAFGSQKTNLLLELAVAQTQLTFYKLRGLYYRCSALEEQVNKLKSKSS